jgi:hypothetical protein
MDHSLFGRVGDKYDERPSPPDVSGEAAHAVTTDERTVDE